jgi:transcriptional regulator with XRE-family HTH domain
VNIGKRLRELCRSQGLSQAHIAKPTGLYVCYICRIECGHTIPQLETLEKWAEALKIPLYQLFLPDEAVPCLGPFARLDNRDRRLLTLLSRMDETNRRLFLSIADTLVKQGGKHGRKK